jgi:hypothetical protein
MTGRKRSLFSRKQCYYLSSTYINIISYNKTYVIYPNENQEERGVYLVESNVIISYPLTLI